MSRGLDTFIYYVTAPIRLFGRSRYFRWGLAAACVAVLFFAATLWASNRFLPPSDTGLAHSPASLRPGFFLPGHFWGDQPFFAPTRQRPAGRARHHEAPAAAATGHAGLPRHRACRCFARCDRPHA